MLTTLYQLYVIANDPRYADLTLIAMAGFFTLVLLGIAFHKKIARPILLARRAVQYRWSKKEWPFLRNKDLLNLQYKQDILPVLQEYADYFHGAAEHQYQVRNAIEKGSGHAQDLAHRLRQADRLVKHTKQRFWRLHNLARDLGMPVKAEYTDYVTLSNRDAMEKFQYNYGLKAD